MLRQKQWKLVVTFPTTADAMATENACKQEEIPGRLIPVPRSISAGCGLAWRTEEEQKTVMEKLLSDRAIGYEQICRCLV